MSAFIWWWTLSSSLCLIITAIIARSAFGGDSTQLIPIAFIVYWISLGLVQWKVLNRYISNAYAWGLVTIVGGIISSFLLVAGWALAFGFLLRNFSLSLGGSNPSTGDFLISSILAIIFLFSSGFLLGWLQKLVLQSSIATSNINNYIVWITGFLWLLNAPLLTIVYFSLARYNPLIYILLVTIFAIFANLLKGSAIRQILSSQGLISEDILSGKTIVQILLVSLVSLGFAYPIRYRILEKIGFTEVLHEAVMNGKINAKKYLDGGGNPNGISKYNRALLHTAAWKENLSLIELLIKKGANINIQDNDRETPLHKAESRSAAELLLKNGANPNARNKNGGTPLHSMWTLDLEVVEVLLKYGAKPNIADFWGKTPLHYLRNSEQAKILLENGANPNVQDKEKNTPLHTIFRIEQIETSEKLKIAAVLIQYGANINVQNKQGSAPLHGVGSSQLAKLLIDAGADVNVRDNIGRTVLHDAYKKDVVELLLTHGADVNAKDNRGETPLHNHARSKEIVKVLIENGADVNAKDNQSKTPLHNHAGSKEIVKVLIENGADVNVKDNQGKTPLNYSN
jgi:ankyrin repeat protein